MLNHLPLPLFLLGLTSLYAGERAFGAGTGRTTLSGVGLALLAVTLVTAATRMAGAQAERRRAFGWVLGGYVTSLLALGLYGVHLTDALHDNDKVRTLLQVAWPGLLLLGMLPTIAMELAIGGMLRTPTLEIWRVRLASRAARIVAFAVVAFAGINYAANTWNRKIDLSYFKTTQAGTSTRAIVGNLTKPVKFILFFPPGNEVLEQARGYLDELKRVSNQVDIEVVDQALEPERAKELRVRQNGYLVVQSGKINESLRLDLDAEDARATLRNLDSEVQKRLLKVIKPERIAYFTTGHSERDYAPPANDKRPSLSDFKTLLESQGFSVRRLGLAEGLGREVPKDATVVLVMGPVEDFADAERNALHRYLKAGGRVLVAIDPDHGVTEDALLAPLGVKVSKALIANARYTVRIENQGESPFNVVTTRGSTHPVASTLEQNPGRIGFVVLGAGTVAKTEPAIPGNSINFAIHAMPESWQDTDGNGKLDKGEPRGNYEFVAAIEREVVPKNAEPANAHAAASQQSDLIDAPGAQKLADKALPEGGHLSNESGAKPDSKSDPLKSEDAKSETVKSDKHDKPQPMRAVVVSDADFATNAVVRNQGNAYFVLDSLRWLAGDEANAGIVESEADVPLVHRKEDDALWFYGTSLLFPAIVLIGGLTYTKRTQRSRRKR